MTLPHGLSRLGPRLFLSFLLASLAGAVSGLAAAVFVPAASYRQLVLQLMRVPARHGPERMEALLSSAITQAVALHVGLSLAVAIAVSLILSAYVSREVTGAIGRLVQATRLLARGRYGERLAPEGIYELAALGGAIGRLAEALDEAQKRRSLAIASVGHELRTPVMALRAYVDALQDGVLDPDPDVLGRMAHSVERLERMAGDLASLAQVEAGAFRELAPVPLTAQEVLESAAQALRPAFAREGVPLQVETPPPPGPTVRADPVRLGEILENLLTNSLNHTPPGRRVTLGARPLAQEVEFFVVDEGEGIAPEDLPHLTEPFYRGAGGSGGHTPRPGMGLGLTIASQLAAAMGGRLSVESPGPGQGTAARLWLPRLPNPP